MSEVRMNGWIVSRKKELNATFNISGYENTFMCRLCKIWNIMKRYY